MAVVKFPGVHMGLLAVERDDSLTHVYMKPMSSVVQSLVNANMQ
jgi:hypothetical protein